MQNVNELIKVALVSRNRAYSPYSKFKVGAALATQGGLIYGGFNIECASYPASNCAERTALFRAIYDGQSEFLAIAVVGGKENESPSTLQYCPPCGVCRQVLREFCNPEKFLIILAKNSEDYKIFTLDELFPNSFGPNFLQ